MNRVLVICTTHREAGIANAAALQAILEHIRPEVIFLELPRSEFDKYVGRISPYFELTVASRYRLIHPVALVPVDSPTPNEVRQIPDFLFETVEGASPEYCGLRYCHAQHVRARGFDFLNSEESDTLLSAANKVMQSTVEGIGDRKLREYLVAWRDLHEHRESAMIQNVEDYSAKNLFNTGVLLVGAEHRQAMIKKSRTRAGEAMPAVEWGFLGA